MRLYVAGPMRGYKYFNFPAFDAASLQLRERGYDVVNPAELDRVEGIHEFSQLPEGFMRQAMKRDMVAICECDGIALLPGWEDSKGVAVEKLLGELLGLEIKELGIWLGTKVDA